MFLLGWYDCHLHMFNIKHPATGLKVEIGIPDGTGEVFGTSELLGHKERISGYFIGKNSSARYEYDFGDSWVHTVKLEKILPAAPGEKYPKCIGGKMACPPEDCGGIYGYYDLLSALSDPKNEEHEEMIEWLGRKIDPERFDPEAASFDDPKWRWKQRFE
ncbi:MAG: plasmid pRiA4b ORF-3 family protein [Bacteroidetes bacterium]|nr:plasmid pRiA4b ORF-3 family protein [Bacteroidota bacterium]